MKVTRRRIRKMILESDRTPVQKLANLIKSQGDVNQAELIASQLLPPVDIFEIFASDWQAVSSVLGKLIDEKKLDDFLYMAADRAFYEFGFFNAMMHVLPNFSSLTFGMSVDEIYSLINQDPGNFDIYQDAETGLGMGWSSVITGTGSVRELVKEWLIAIAFLKIESLYMSKSKNVPLSDIIANLRGF